MPSSFREALLHYAPVGYWALDHVSADPDLSDGAHAASFTNGGTGAHRVPSLLRSLGAQGRSSFDGSANSYWSVPSYTSLDQPAFSGCCWFLSRVATDQIIISRDSGGGARPFFFRINSAGKCNFVDNGSTNAFTGTRADLQNGRIHFVGFYYTTNLIEFWVDGRLDSSQAGATAPTGAGATDLYLGRHNTGVQGLQGTMAHAAIIPSRLDAGDWAALYRAGAADLQVRGAF